MKATARPRADATITLADGRTLAYCEWGNPTGSPVLLVHGAPGSRLLCPDEDATAGAGVRLLTVDRPGYGARTLVRIHLCSAGPTTSRPWPIGLVWTASRWSAGPPAVAMRWPVLPGCPSASARSAWPAARGPMTRCRVPGRRT